LRWGAGTEAIAQRFALVALAGALALIDPPACLAQQSGLDAGHTGQLLLLRLPARRTVPLTVTSPAFRNGADIPLENTQYGGNTFPGLAWSPGPSGTRSYVIVMQGEGSDAPRGLSSIHLTLYNVPTDVRQLEPGLTSPPPGASFGPNVHGLDQPYAGPHTHGMSKHAYHLQVFALDTRLPVNPGVRIEALVDAMSGHVLASGELVGQASMAGTAP